MMIIMGNITYFTLLYLSDIWSHSVNIEKWIYLDSLNEMHYVTHKLMFSSLYFL